MADKEKRSDREGESDTGRSHTQPSDSQRRRPYWQRPDVIAYMQRRRRNPRGK